MLRRVALVRTDVSEKTIGELGTFSVTSNRRTLLVTANVPSSPILVTLMMEALSSSETSGLTGTIPEDAILHTE
jgi:hypothetical protein